MSEIGRRKREGYRKKIENLLEKSSKNPVLAAECVVDLIAPNDGSDGWYARAIVGAFQLVEAKEAIIAIAKGLSKPE